MHTLADPQAWLGLFTLTVLEVVLNIDNIVFVSILSGRLAPHDRPRARRLGLSLATGTRLLLLFSLVWLMRLTRPLFAAFGRSYTGHDLILLAGGLFLVWKSTQEIHQRLEGEPDPSGRGVHASLVAVIAQIMLLDIVFSLDSVFTAIGMAKDLSIMVAAILIAALVMILSARVASHFIERHPTIKMLALSFLLLIGFTMISQSFGQEIPKGYIYFSMTFAIFVELLNLRTSRGSPVHLHEPYGPEQDTKSRRERRTPP